MYHHCLPVIRVPITAEDRTSMSSEHPLIAVRTPDVPQLNISILKGSSKSEIILHTELYISHTLGLAWKKSNVKKKYCRETFFFFSFTGYIGLPQ